MLNNHLDNNNHTTNSNLTTKDTGVSNTLSPVQKAGQTDLWPEEVEGKALYDELVGTFNRYLALQPHQADALALWSIFSYCIDTTNIAPKLLVYSPEKRCGKTTLLDVLMGVAWKPLSASNITPAAMFRAIEHLGGTIVIDEADTFIRSNPEINGIINSGHRKSMAFVVRCEGENHIPKSFSTWTPMVIAMIGKPADTIIDRSILIEMKRKKPEDEVERFSPYKAEEELKTLSLKIGRWARDNFDALCSVEPAIPTGMNDRAEDNWRPLLAIAELIGEECAKIARKAAIALTETEEDEDNASPGVMLLADIKYIFENKGEIKISTKNLLKELDEMEDRPWAEWNRGYPITPRQIAKHLKPFGVRSKKMRIGKETPYGYELSTMEDAFSRYLEGTAEQANEINNLYVPASPPVLEQTHLNGTANPLINKGCSGVPIKIPAYPQVAPSIFDD